MFIIDFRGGGGFRGGRGDSGFRGGRGGDRGRGGFRGGRGGFDRDRDGGPMKGGGYVYKGFVKFIFNKI